MRNWKVGSITAGILLIAIGLLWFLQSFIEINYATLLLNAWPVACILLGIEILVFHLLKKEESLHFHWLSIFLLVFVMFISIAFNFGHLFFKELGISLHSTKVEIKDEKSIPSNINEIVIDGEDGEFNVVGTNSTNLKVNGSIWIPDKNSKQANAKLADYYSMKTIGNKLLIEVKEDKFNFINLNDSNTELNIEIPKNLMSTIKLDDGSINLENKTNKTVIELNDGNINVEQINGTLIAKTENGSINITHATLTNDSKILSEDGEINIENVTGLINAKTSNGSIKIDQANLLNNSTIKTNDGEISLDNVKGALIANTNNGSIVLNNTVLNGNSRFTTDDGSVDIGLINQNDLKIKAKTEDGSIEGNIEWNKNSKNGGNNKDAILGNGSHEVFIQTKNGSIAVNSN